VIEKCIVLEVIKLQLNSICYLLKA